MNGGVVRSYRSGDRILVSHRWAVPGHSLHRHTGCRVSPELEPTRPDTQPSRPRPARRAPAQSFRQAFADETPSRLSSGRPYGEFTVCSVVQSNDSNPNKLLWQLRIAKQYSRDEN